MKRKYGLIYYDNDRDSLHYKPFLSKKGIKEFINGCNLGKDCISYFSIIKMVGVWNAYDGVTYPEGGLNL